MKKASGRLLTGNRGQALVMVILLIGVGLMVVTPFLYMAATSMNQVRVVRKHVQAFYAADAGVDYGRYLIQDGLTAYTGSLPESLNDIDVTLDIVEVGGDLFEITVDANRDGILVVQLWAEITRQGAGTPAEPYEAIVTDWEKRE